MTATRRRPRVVTGVTRTLCDPRTTSRAGAVALLAATASACGLLGPSGADLGTAMEVVCDPGTIEGTGDERTCEVGGREADGRVRDEDPSDDLDYWITDVVGSADSYRVAWAVGRDGDDWVTITVVDLDDASADLEPLTAEGFTVGVDDPVEIPR